ncbi:MAG: four helix bundle protein [Coxiellaceae bacterium]|nr:four helix bundle protein [Coxiellaceae bacterium]
MSVENLKVFKKSHKLTLNLYKLTTAFPSDERFGLVSQIRRAGASICANLIEGSHRNNTKEYRHFAGISRGSVGELKYHLLLAKDLDYISEPDYKNYAEETNEISKMLYGLVRALDGAHSHSPSH